MTIGILVDPDTGQIITGACGIRVVDDDESCECCFFYKLTLCCASVFRGEGPDVYVSTLDPDIADLVVNTNAIKVGDYCYYLDSGTTPTECAPGDVTVAKLSDYTIYDTCVDAPCDPECKWVLIASFTLPICRDDKTDSLVYPCGTPDQFIPPCNNTCCTDCAVGQQNYADLKIEARVDGGAWNVGGFDGQTTVDNGGVVADPCNVLSIPYGTVTQGGGGVGGNVNSIAFNAGHTIDVKTFDTCEVGPLGGGSGGWYIQNLGRTPICVNGTTVNCGECIGTNSPSCDPSGLSPFFNETIVVTCGACA